MLFNSLVFLIFIAAFFCVWPVMRRNTRLRWGFLIAASFVFYGWWDWRYLFLIVGVGVANFLAGQAMARFPSRKKPLLVVSVIINLLPLAVLKYLDFGISNINWLLGLLGVDYQVPVTHMGMVVGISFYTFQAMSYTIDIYRGQLLPTRHLTHFLAYLSLFPQLVAGPIVRARHLLPQLEESRPITEEQRWQGLKLIVFGYFKKAVVADTLAPTVSAAFSANTPEASCSYWWVVMLMFSYQIYCDFSGYSDIARGLGKWLGYDFPVNFDHPYISSSFREFWSRWHISLSTWFRDYIYIPLGGSKTNSRFATEKNMWITMLLSGLWHGAAWHFIIWAAIHSFCLSTERLTGWTKRLAKVPLGRHFATLAVFLLTTIAWVFFRAENFGQAVSILAAMFNLANWNSAVVGELIDNNAVNVLLIIVARQLYFHFRLDSHPLATSKAKWRKVLEPVVMALLILTCVYMRGSGAKFIYFQF